MRGLKTTLASVFAVGLLTGSVVGVSAHEEAEDAMSLPASVEMLAGLGLPGATDDNAGTHSLGLYQYPGYDNISFVSDEDWCLWFVSWLVEGDEPSDGQLTLCDSKLKTWYDPEAASIVVPEFIATFIVTYKPPDPPDTLTDGSLTRGGEGERTTKEFLLDGDATYDIIVDAPEDCDDFSAWLRLRGAPDRYPRLITQDIELYLEQEELWFWDVETSCDGGWALTVRAESPSR